MNLDTEKIRQCADTLENNSHEIIELCNQIEDLLQMATQCMDQESGRGAAQRLSQNIETIKRNVPINDDACRRLILALRRIQNAGEVFGRR